MTQCDAEPANEPLPTVTALPLPPGGTEAEPLSPPEPAVIEIASDAGPMLDLVAARLSCRRLVFPPHCGRRGGEMR